MSATPPVDPPVDAADDDAATRAMHRMSRRGLLALGVSAGAAFGGWKWLTTRPAVDGLPYPFRDALEVNERIWAGYFDGDRLAPTFSPAMAREPRVNGTEGMSDGFDPVAWRLHVVGPGEPRALRLEDIHRLPRVEMTTELKCIEGWSVIVTWAGARFRDFVAAYSPGSEARRYVGLSTPDRGYYVGFDMPSALHPQTLLCYEMNGGPLPIAHGGPLRLVTTVKYGMKSIKRIGTIAFADERPADFWAEQGYDWYLGH